MSHFTTQAYMDYDTLKGYIVSSACFDEGISTSPGVSSQEILMKWYLRCFILQYIQIYIVLDSKFDEIENSYI